MLEVVADRKAATKRPCSTDIEKSFTVLDNESLRRRLPRLQLRPRRQGRAEARHRLARSSMVWHGDAAVPASDLIVLPGGFSYGDYLRCGAMAAHSPIMRDVIAKAKAGTPVLGICNGFQVLSETGLLPGVLMRNASLQVHLPRRAPAGRAATSTLFTKPLPQGRGRSACPIAHARRQLLRRRGHARPARGRRAASCSATVDEAGDATPQANPNGAQRNIAGICDASRPRSRPDAASRAAVRAARSAAPTAAACSKALLGRASRSHRITFPRARARKKGRLAATSPSRRRAVAVALASATRRPSAAWSRPTSRPRPGRSRTPAPCPRRCRSGRAARPAPEARNAGRAGTNLLDRLLADDQRQLADPPAGLVVADGVLGADVQADAVPAAARRHVLSAARALCTPIEVNPASMAATMRP